MRGLSRSDVKSLIVLTVLLRAATRSQRHVSTKLHITTGRYQQRQVLWPTTPFVRPIQNVQSQTTWRQKTTQAHATVNAPANSIAIVFTDIVKSTALWEKHASTMTEAMTIHDDLIRRLCAVHRGYEVKQNGDGFMLAFQSVADTLRFCLDIQTELQKQDWPEKLLDMRPSEPIIENENAEPTSGDAQNGKALWKGLRLRVSAHFGEPVQKWNEITERMDYLGPIVNRAARFVSVCEGGQIVVSSEFLSEVHKIQSDDHGLSSSPSGSSTSNKSTATSSSGRSDSATTSHDSIGREYTVQLLGERQLAGISGTERLYFIVPKSLIGRLEYFPKNTYVRASKGNLLEN